VLVLAENGDVASVTGTVAHHVKIVGRVGGSAVIGADLYPDSGVGAAGARFDSSQVVTVM
jgi:isoaspartyl peptidase/L-asparaginase-like protein (Ntn-hydrolase superfamily)